MGADLHIKNFKPTEKAELWEVSRDAVVKGGYFRDCYNSSGLFAFFTNNTSKPFSWWLFDAEAKENGWRNKKTGDMKVVGIKVLLERVQAAVKEIEAKKSSALRYKDFLYMKDHQIKMDDKGNAIQVLKRFDKPEETKKEYLEWGNNLITFLTMAIELKSPVCWSV